MNKSKLPPEIRNAIYGFAFTRSAIKIVGKPVYSHRLGRSKFRWKRENVRHSHSRWESRNEAESLPVAFLRCRRRVHAEARAMLYANNFEVQDMETLAVWLKDLGGNIACLRNIGLGTEPQIWAPRPSSKTRAQQNRYREVCRKVAKMLAGAENLQALRMVFLYNHMMGAPALSATLKRPGPVSGWIDLARRVAEALYHDFRPVYSKNLTRGQTPEKLSRVLQVSRNNWWGYRHASDPRQLNAKEAGDAEREVLEHLRLLLERNLYFRLNGQS
ncbi:hypothetical protein CORC01_11787 [Colletotrichum orchidophilum]|uniref:DUF7730 domain-containing protein n=1 Tax=Colletotrichum orchidophilum TaxID=1209926 RepID=A0A1G4AUS1_9PEZI|nr:uncharacterized protein CORC01_11787 [Colletotrichum orchidophilum]OHE92920.1 hypothetical protein CORC01_11787 [Colletotrichum orchidophilum]